MKRPAPSLRAAPRRAAPRRAAPRPAPPRLAAPPAAPAHPAFAQPPTCPPTHSSRHRWNNLLGRAVKAPILPLMKETGGAVGYTAAAHDQLKYSVPAVLRPQSWDHAF